LTTLLPPAVVFPLFLLVMTALTLLAWRRRPLPAAMAATAVGTLLFIPGITEAYFIHPIIWGGVRRGPGYWVFSLTTYFFLLSGPGNLQVWSGFLPWNLPWLALCFWGFLLLRERPRPSMPIWPSPPNTAHASAR
jgi:hypothetical protein